MSRGLIVVEGLPGLKAALSRKVEELRVSSQMAVAEEVKTIEADARQGAPVDTGALHDGIESEAFGLTGVIHTTVLHSAAQEFGTTRNAAHPFMRPAAEKARRRFPARAAAIIKAALGG